MSTSENCVREIVIQVERLSKSYGDVKAVRELSFDVKQGEIFGFLGPNGAGKTTTLSILEGACKADGGRAVILGMDVQASPRDVKRHIGVQLQSTSLLPDLTVLEQLHLFASLYGCRRERPAIVALLERVGLAEKASVLPEQLSGGQQQRLSLALALINDPQIVFLDEPTTGLDPQSRRVLWDIIRELQSRDKTIVLTTHYMEEAEALCDRVGIIDAGALAALDRPGSLINGLTGVSSITTSAYLPLAELQSLSVITTIQRNGRQLHLQTDDVARALSAILELAARHEVSLHDLHIKQPNLEDVFLNLTGRTLRA